MVRTLFDRTNLITDEQDRQEEESHITKALRTCQYPQWAINKGRQQVKDRENKKGLTKKKNDKDKNAGTVTLPYIRGITERIQHVMRKHNINTPVKPHKKLRQILVHPKDKIKPEKKCNVIYEIPCQSCNKTYIGETGRAFSIRKKEHKTECEKETRGASTRATQKKAEQENLKSAITDHCRRERHVMDWDNAKVIGMEDNKYKRWIKEAIEIRKRAHRTVNRDEGAYQLSRTWDAVLKKSDTRWRYSSTYAGRRMAPKSV